MESYETRKLKLLRNVGWGVLCTLPYIVAGGVLLWALAISGWVDLTKELRQERRAMESVGIHVYPRNPIKLKVFDAPCIKVDQAYLDGDHVSFYAVNKCKGSLVNSFYVYRVAAPDETVIESHSYLFPGEQFMYPGERKEVTQDINNDNRTDMVYIILGDGKHDK